ncbi:MAG: GC-type dockerin domain-anchored protein [Planctomycetota bacterium]
MMRCTLTAAAVAALAGQAMGQIVVDGTRDAQYELNFVQSNPTSFADNGPQDPCVEDVSDAANVMTGAEFCIPLSALGHNGTDPISFIAVITNGGHDFWSNQISGGIGDGMGGQNPTGDNLGDPRGLDLGAIDGNQVLTVATSAATAPVIDGTLDAAYGAALFVNGVATSFGDGDDAAVDTNTGDEINAIYAATDATNLYIFVAGNLNTAFNKLDLFIDSNAGVGQNQLRGDNPDVDFNGLNRMGNSDQAGVDAMTATADGVIFEPGFAADFFVQYTHGDGGGPATFCSFAEILDDPSMATGEFIGGGTDTGPGGELIINGSMGTIGEGASIALNNSNIGGVSGLCPPPLGPNASFGDEIDSVSTFLDIPNNKLYVFVAGNLDVVANNPLVLFVDSTSDGQNVLGTDQVDIDFGALRRHATQEINQGTEEEPDIIVTPGLTFDAGFTANNWISVKVFDINNPNSFVNSAVIRANGRLLDPVLFANIDYGSFDGGVLDGAGPINFDGPQLDLQDGLQDNIFANYSPRLATQNTYLEFPLLAPVDEGIVNASDLSNSAGVTDTEADAFEAFSVDTGIELCLDLDELDWNGTDPIRIAGWIASSDYSFLSNQVIGGLPTADELGEVSQVDFSMITGDQFITVGNVIPDPQPSGSVCGPADLTTTGATLPGQPGFGEPDENVDLDDLGYFLGFFLNNDASVADLTTSGATLPGQPGFGVPDGFVDLDDLGFFLNLWLQGCPQ